MIDYHKQARMIFDMVVSMPVVSTDETIRRVEERIRKIAHAEHGMGYHERMVEENNRHEEMAKVISDHRNRFNAPQVG